MSAAGLDKLDALSVQGFAALCNLIEIGWEVAIDDQLVVIDQIQRDGSNDRHAYKHDATLGGITGALVRAVGGEPDDNAEVYS